MKYFISHEDHSIKEAVKLKELLLEINNEHKIFLTSDWDSLQSGNLWMSDIINSLIEMDEVLILITRKDAFKNLWINFEIGAAIGRKLKPKIFVFGGVSLSDMEYPMKGIHVISTGDTNRWVLEFKRLGYEIKNIEPFSKLFCQSNNA
jgi:hypothetical protein